MFLTGDMHCCYHATMRIGDGSKYECTTVHELAGGPANQLQLATVAEFDHRGTGAQTCRQELDYEVVLERFHSEVNAVMHLTVEYQDAGSFRRAAAVVPEVEWNVIRTLTDEGASRWSRRHDSRPRPQQVPTAAHPRDGSWRAGDAGRISFVRKRAS